MDVVYTGEHLFVGNLGYFFVSLSFGAAIFAFIAYLIATITHEASWKKLGRIGFFAHLTGVVGILVVLGCLISHHYYEYFYVWDHSSNSLPAAYMLACFWEGQEGSFLLWTFWHVVLGSILVWKAKDWESPVMAVIVLAQVMLSAMLLGLDLWGDEMKELGMNPFRLLRTEMEAPIFNQANYLTKLTDGTGLNPLLQNYWNVIHPPVLFLGFALTIVPFAYIMAGLFTKNNTGWVKAVMPWTAVTVGVLGLGILMGGAWAYEALSFGGFWAWDPVENAVLVPWLVAAAGLHTLVIFKNTGKALLSAMLMLAAAFILILYSTFLTRSGILGDTSVHSFTDLGLSGQLLLFLLMFVVLFAIALLVGYKHIPRPKTEDALTSRELWMLVGSIVLIVSAFQVIFSTSIPVLNKVIGFFVSNFNMAPPTNPVAHYNRFQIPFAILVALLTAGGQYFKYRKSPDKVWKKLLTGFLISLPIAVIFILGAQVYDALLLVLLIASVFTIVGNVQMLLPYFKSGKWRFGGASIAHIGIGLIFIGALISNGKRQVVSRNNAGIDFGENYTDEEKVVNVMLPKGKPIPMGGYLITYLTDSFVEPNHYYKVEYKKLDAETGKTVDRFFLYPKAQISEQMGLASDPSILRNFGWDLYTHVTSVPTGEEKGEWEDAENYTVSIGDTLKYRDMEFIVRMINLSPPIPEAYKEVKDSLYATTLEMSFFKDGKEYNISPYFIISGSKLFRPAAYNDDLGLRAFFVNINRDTKDFEIALALKNDPSPDYIIMKAMVFPMINLLWLGCILLFIGSIMAAYRRVLELKSKP
ncbi:cytochrome C biogenesis protein [bacterium]|nr:cytochrome C biogenesis protein [bacterium]